MKKLVNMREALDDPELFGTILDGSSWQVWRILLIAIMGEPLTEDEREVFRTLTKREYEPGQPVEEFWAVVGRRGGKTRAMSVLSAYLAALCDWSDVLVPGERGRLSYLASTMKQASIAFQYANAIFDDLPLFSQMVTNRSSEVISLNNRIDMEIRASSWRSVRGVTSIAALFDELAFFATDEASANLDREILNALRPSLVTTGGPLIAISSPFGRNGEVYRAVEKYHNPDADPRILVARGGSRDFNPSLPQSYIDRQLERDPVSARSEWLGEFRDTETAFVDLPTVEACITPGVTMRPPRRNGATNEMFAYHAFCDPSGGRADAMTLAIAHDEVRRGKEGKLSQRETRGVAVVDLVLEKKPPFRPNHVVWEFAKTLKTYGVSTIYGDAYAGEWVRDEFERAGIRYIKSRRSKSDIFVDFLPSLNDGTVELLDDPTIVSQLVTLQRRVTPSNREIIDHRAGGHDDIANVVAGACTLVAMKRRRGRTVTRTWSAY